MPSVASEVMHVDQNCIYSIQDSLNLERPRVFSHVFTPFLSSQEFMDKQQQIRASPALASDFQVQVL